MSPQVSNAINTIDRLIPLVEDAERQFKSARNWSFLDVLGGGMIVDMIKHYKLNKAGNTMEEVNYLLQQLSRELGSLSMPEDYRMQMGGFLSFADFLFDGVFVDAFMASKIMSSLNEVRKLKDRLIELKRRLEVM